MQAVSPAFGAVPKPATAQKAAVAASVQVQFGADQADLKGAAQAAEKPMSRWDLVKTLFEYFRKAENKQIMKAFLYQALPFAALAAGPFGWIFGYLPAHFLAKRGEKLQAELMKAGKLEKEAGPLAKAMNIKHLWEQAPHDAVPKIVENWNKGVDELLTDQERVPKIKQAAKYLKLKTDGRVSNFLNHFFHTQRLYKKKWIGQILDWLGRTGGRLRFIGMPLRVLRFVGHGLLMLFSYRKVKVMMAAAKK